MKTKWNYPCSGVFHESDLYTFRTILLKNRSSKHKKLQMKFPS